LIAGERRLRATNIGWTEIAAIVRDLDDRTMLVLALVENLRRSISTQSKRRVATAS
jgi:ParB family chromosome partitioning protein